MNEVLARQQLPFSRHSRLCSAADASCAFCTHTRCSLFSFPLLYYTLLSRAYILLSLPSTLTAQQVRGLGECSSSSFSSCCARRYPRACVCLFGWPFHFFFFFYFSLSFSLLSVCASFWAVVLPSPAAAVAGLLCPLGVTAAAAFVCTWQQLQPLLGFTGGILIESTLTALLTDGGQTKADIVAAHSLTHSYSEWANACVESCTKSASASVQWTNGLESRYVLRTPHSPLVCVCVFALHSECCRKDGGREGRLRPSATTAWGTALALALAAASAAAAASLNRRPWLARAFQAIRGELKHRRCGHCCGPHWRGL